MCPDIYISNTAFSYMIMSNTNNEQWKRLDAVLGWAGMFPNCFARETGLPDSECIYRIKRGQSSISPDIANRIVQRFPELNKEWLLSGEGEMLLGGH